MAPMLSFWLQDTQYFFLVTTSGLVTTGGLVFYCQHIFSPFTADTDLDSLCNLTMHSRLLLTTPVSVCLRYHT